jgi:heme-degrading monooxygenase HmoA
MERNETVIRPGDEPVRVLAEGTEKAMRHRPGFVSVNVLASYDGTRVVNYAQWRSPEDVHHA